MSNEKWVKETQEQEDYFGYYLLCPKCEGKGANGWDDSETAARENLFKNKHEIIANYKCTECKFEFHLKMAAEYFTGRAKKPRKPRGAPKKIAMTPGQKVMSILTGKPTKGRII